MPIMPRHLPPPRNHQDFEDWCVRVFRRVLQCPRLTRHGRNGQSQRGLDLSGVDVRNQLIGVQCKLRNLGELDEQEIEDGIREALEKNPDIKHIEFATTQRRDATLRDYVLRRARELRVSNDCGLEISFWEDIEDQIHGDADLLASFVGDLGGPREDAILTALRGLDGRMAAMALQPQAPKVEGPSALGATTAAAFDLVTAGKFDVAVEQLLSAKKSQWEQLSEAERYSLAKAIGNAYYAGDDYRSAAGWFLEARQHSDSDEALCLEARAYQYKDDHPKALGILQTVLQRTSGLAHAHALHIMLSCDSYDDLLQSTPVNVHKHVEVALALSFRAFDAGKVDAAVSHARDSHIASPGWHVAATHLGSMLLKRAHGALQADFDGNPVLIDKRDVAEAESLLSEVLTKQDALSAYSRAMAYYNRSSARKLLGRREEGAADLDEAVRLQPAEKQFLATLGATLGTAGNSNEAIRILERASKLPGQGVGVEVLLALELRDRGNPGDLARAIRVLEGAREQAREESAEHGFEYAHILGRMRQQADSKAYSENALPVADVLDLLPSDPRSVLQAWWLAELGNGKEALRLLSEIASIERLQAEAVYRVRIAETYSKAGQFGKTIAILRPYSVATAFTQDTHLLLKAATEAANDSVYLEVSEQLRLNNAAPRSVLLNEAQLRHKYDDSSGALEILGAWLNTHEGDADAWVIRGNIAVDANQQALVKDCIAHLPRPEEVNERAVTGVFRLLARSTDEPDIGRAQYGYRLWRANRKNPQAWQGVIALGLFANQPASAKLSAPAAVGEGTTVVLDVEGTREVVCIEGGLDPDPSWEEFSLGTPIVDTLIGATVGAVVELPGKYRGRKVTVLSIQASEQAVAPRCLARWEHFFPQIPFVWQFSIPKESGESTDANTQRALAPILAIAQQRRQRVAQVLSVYEQNPLPVWMLAKALEIHEVEAFEGLTQSAEPGLHCLRGSGAEQVEQEQCLRKAESLVIDTTAAVTLMRLGATAKILEGVKVLVPGRLIAEIRSHSLATSGRLQPAGTAFEQGGRVAFVPTSAEESKRRASELAAFSAAVQSLATIVDGLPLAQLPTETRTQFEDELLGPVGARSVAIARSRSVPVWTDDIAVEIIGRSEAGVQRVSTAAIIEWLRKIGKIDVDDASDWLAQLHLWNYSGIPIRPDILVGALSRSGWDTKVGCVQRMVATVLERANEPAAVARFVLQTTKLLWRRCPLSPGASDILLWFLQRVATRPDGLAIVRGVYAAMDAAFGVDVFGAAHARTVVGAWLAAQQRS